MRTVKYGPHRLDYQHDEVLGLPAVCLLAITGPGLPNLRITPEGTEPAVGSERIEGEGQIVFENGSDPACRMAFPVFNPNSVRSPNWVTNRRPPRNPGIAPSGIYPQDGLSEQPRSLHHQLDRIATRFHHFGRHYVVYHSSLYANEPTVKILYILGPGLPNLGITPEGVESLDGTGLDEGKGCLRLHIAITRDDLPLD